MIVFFFFRHLRVSLPWGLLSLCVVQGGFAFALDLNHASRSQLLAIKGIGAKTADRILSARHQGPFASLDDFASRVSGFGPAKREALRQQGVTIGRPTTQAATHKPPAVGSNKAADAALNATTNATSSVPPHMAPHRAAPDMAPDNAPDGAQPPPNALADKAMPAMPMLIRPRPRQPAREDDRNTRAERSAPSAPSEQAAAARAGVRNKIH